MEDKYTPEELEQVIGELSVCKKDGVKLAHRGDTVFIKNSAPISAADLHYWASKLTKRSKLDIVFLQNGLEAEIDNSDVVKCILEQIDILSSAPEGTTVSNEEVVKMLAYIISVYESEKKVGGE